MQTDRILKTCTEYTESTKQISAESFIQHEPFNNVVNFSPNYYFLI